MIVGKYTKQSFEVMPLGVDFVKELIADDDVIVNYDVLATDLADQSDAAGAILEGGPLLGDSIRLDADGLPIRTNTRLIQRVREGASPGRYVLSYRIITALGHQWEGDVYLIVLDT